MSLPEPFCPSCGKRPEELEEYIEAGEVRGITPSEYVKCEEGTYNCDNGHFLCTPCYIKHGMPSGPRGWVCQ